MIKIFITLLALLIPSMGYPQEFQTSTGAKYKVVGFEDVDWDEVMDEELQLENSEQINSFEEPFDVRSYLCSKPCP